MTTKATPIRLFDIDEECFVVHLTTAGLKVLQEVSPHVTSLRQPMTLRDLLRIFGPTFGLEGNPQLFESNGLELHLGY